VRNSSALLLVLVLVASSIVSVLPVKAEARTLVVPDDYATISLAIENALDGDTVFVKKGTYQESTLAINKSLLLIGEDVDGTILNLDPPLVEAMIQ
jgi:pectin methylesterase-like acyl-CoA thioesterase